MNPMLLSIPLILAVCIVTAGFDAGLPGEPEAEIIRLENEMMRAFQGHDRSTLDRIIGDQFLLTSAISNEQQIGKRHFIDGGWDQIRVESFRFHDFRIRFFGTTTIANCRLDWKSTWAGMQWESDFTMTDVWLRSGREWQIVTPFELLRDG